MRTPQGTITTTRMPGTGGERKLLFKYGPVRIHPGQNTISITPTSLRPPKGGWITSFHPNLTYTNGKVPPVDVIHLHHAVWLINRPGDAYRPTWAAGEEKTIFRTPKGFGWHFKTSDQWLLNHMIHNLFPTPTSVYITWEMTFIPDGTPAAKGMKEVKTQWLDVEGGKAYPVFDVLQGTGHGGQYTFPDDNPNAYPDGNRAQPLGRRPRRARSWARPATCTRAACGPTSSSRAATAPSSCSAPRRSTASPRARSRGTSR